MGLWSRLIRRKPAVAAPDPLPAAPSTDVPPPPATTRAVELPIEPFVFECRECGKVFEARRVRPPCPECDSHEVSLLSE